MDHTNDSTEVTRSQPWKEWVKEELEARKKADMTEEGRKAQEERVKAYTREHDDTELNACALNGNKAG